MHRIADTTNGSHSTVTLSAVDAQVDATVAPGVGMIVCSLRHRGVELLGQRGGLEAYAASGSTMGIPLLHPWANRLSGFAYAVGGTRIALDPRSPLLHHDAHGLPMHGLLAASPHWNVEQRTANADRALLCAAFDFGAHPELLAAFPFPHVLTLEIELRGAVLTITTGLRPSGAVAVPIAFGFHPYLQLPDVERAAWHIEAAVRRHLLLDDRNIPTGASEAIFIEPGPLADRTYDDLYTDLQRPAHFLLAGGGRRITVEFDDGYRFAQIYAPEGDALICFEPMTAPTNALVSGTGLALVAPGTEYRAGFSIDVADAP